jgi:hypothetical protein
MTERTNDECLDFFIEKLKNGVERIAWLYTAEDSDITPAKLRYIRDEISLFLGDPINAQELLSACEALVDVYGRECKPGTVGAMFINEARTAIANAKQVKS